jgi:hypothetical protein
MMEFASVLHAAFDSDWRAPAGVAARDALTCGGFHSSRTDEGRWLSRCFSSALRALGQQGGDGHEVVGEHRLADEQRETLGAFGAATLHAAPAHQHRDAPLDAGAKALALFERLRPFAGLALRRFTAATLRKAYGFDGALHARRYVLFAEEAAIAGVKFRRSAESMAGAPEQRRHMNFVRRFALAHLILCDQTFCAFSKKHLATEFHRRAHFAAFDQIGVGLEDRIDLLGIGHLLAFEHAAARLTNHPLADTAVGYCGEIVFHATRRRRRAAKASRRKPGRIVRANLREGIAAAYYDFQNSLAGRVVG